MSSFDEQFNLDLISGDDMFRSRINHSGLDSHQLDLRRQALEQAPLSEEERRILELKAGKQTHSQIGLQLHKSADQIDRRFKKAKAILNRTLRELEAGLEE